MKSQTKAIVAVVVAAVIGSAVAGITKKGLGEIPPYSFTFLRFAIAALFVLPFFLHIKGHKLVAIREVIPTSLFATINVLFYILGLSFTTANIGAVIYAGVPLLTAVILFIFFRKRLSKKTEMGLFVGFIGVLFITLLPVLEKGNPFAGNLLGNVFLTIAIISWSFYQVYSKTLQEKYSPFIITCSFIFLSAIVMIPFFLWDFQTHYGWWNHVTGWGIFSIFYVAIVITVLNYMLNQYAIKHSGAVLASMMFYVMPVFSIIFNFWLLGELLTPGFIFGSLLALAGTYLVIRK